MAEISIEQIQAAGVVGAGGAGFPTHVKLSGRADTVLIYAAECEPLLHKDKQLLKTQPDAVLAGLAAAMRLVGAVQGIIGIKEKYQDVIEALRPKLAAKMDIAPMSDVYPAGDELILVYDVLGRVVPPGQIPLDVGAVVINVETAVNVVAAADRPVTEKYLTVGGAVAEPATLRVPVGTTLRECVAAAGGATVGDPHYLVGGVMMGDLEDDHDAPVDKTTSGIIVLPSDHVVVRRYRRDWQQIVRIGRSACDQCSFCTELCPRYLLGHPVEPHRAMRSLAFNLVGEANVLGTAFCCECNLCSFYSCPEELDPKSLCAHNKRKLAVEKRLWNDPPFHSNRPRMHLKNRKAPMARLMQKLGLNRFVNVGPLNDGLLHTDRVGIKLKQHIGAACQPMVRVGQKVQCGQQVGSPPESNGRSALGAPIHASIDGTVAAVDSGVIWIER